LINNSWVIETNLTVPPNMLMWNRLTRQYLVCPPCTSVTALILLCMEFIRAFILLMGILSHSSNKAAPNWSRVAGAFRRPLTLLSISSHRCSIGDKSGLYGGQSNGLMLWLGRKSWRTLATWGGALSCWKIRWCCCTNGTATGRRISSLYLTLVKLPVITINGDFNPWDIPLQIITGPPPNLSLSRMQASAKHSPEHRYTRRRPSGRKRVNRDSSVKKTHLHCLTGNCLGPCATNQAIPRARHARVRGKPM
jgi:hypothetical protein